MRTKLFCDAIPLAVIIATLLPNLVKTWYDKKWHLCFKPTE